MLTGVPLLPARTRVVCDPARALRRIQGLTMQKVTAETLNELLGIRELVVTEYAFEQQGHVATVHIICEHRYEVAVCPRCGEVSTALHESEMRCVRHLDIWGKMTLLHFPSRRFDCDKCKKPFTEKLPWIEEQRRQTLAFERHIYQQCQQASKSAVAQNDCLHFKTVSTIFNRWAKRAESDHHRPLVRRLGVDEISLKKRHQQYALVLSDLDRCCVIDVFPERTQKVFAQWLDGLSAAERAAIQVVAMDMWRPYRDVVRVKLSHAQTVADRFHVMKQLNDRLSQVRRNLQRKADDQTHQALKGTRWLLVKNRADLTTDEEARLQAALDASPTLRQAYLLKETFRTICEKINDREQAERFLTAWVWQAEASGIPQLRKFASTLRNWWSEFLNYFHDRVTSGIVEGLNNGIRYIIRRACGYHVFEHFRLQVLVEHGGLDVFPH
jgi:transposase